MKKTFLLSKFLKRLSTSSVFKAVLLLTTFFLVERFCHKKTGGFQIAKIQSTHPFHPEWETPIPSDEKLATIRGQLGQRYTFFSYGGQSYAFLSEDGKTILKLFKQHHMRFPLWMKKMPLPRTLNRIRNKWIHRKEDKFSLFFNSCKIAHDDFKQRTGLIYLHLNTTKYLKQTLTLVDKLGIEHEIDLDRTDFALQHRAKMPKKHFQRLKKKNDFASAKRSLDSLIDMIVERSQKGIADRDPNIRRNCGFLGDQAVEIDLGSYTYNETLKIPFLCKADIYQKSLQLKRMISKVYPELSSHLEQRLAEILDDPQEASL